MNWELLLKKPMVPNNQLVSTLLEMQRENPNIFSESREINNPLQMIDDMLDDLRQHSHYGSAMELKVLEQNILDIQAGFKRLEELA